MNAYSLKIPFTNGFIEKIDRKNISKKQNNSKQDLIEMLNEVLDEEVRSSAKTGNCYVIPRINYGAGIGHQMSCWAAAFNMSECYDIGFINPHIWINGGHQESDDYIQKKFLGCIPYKKQYDVWDKVLGIEDVGVELGQLNLRDYKLIRIPRFDSRDGKSLDLLGKIIEEARGKAVIFQLSLDQEFNGWPSATFLNERFWNASIRKDDRLGYSDEFYNVAIHIRRGDVTSQMTDRYKNNEYYVNAINDIRNGLKDIAGKPIRFNVISEGTKDDFKELATFDDVDFMVSMNSKESFLHIVYADACLISPSGFAAIAAALNKGRKYTPCEYKVFQDEVEWNYMNADGELVTE